MSSTPKPEPIELNGTLQRHELPGHATLVLNSHGLRQISAALEAIRTCSDLLNHSASEAGEGLPTFCQQTTHGILSAIGCCAAVIESQVTATDTEGALLLRGADAQEIDSHAWRAWHRSYTAQGGTK